MKQKYDSLPKPSKPIPPTNALLMQQRLDVLFSVDEWQIWGNIVCEHNNGDAIPLLYASLTELDSIDMYDDDAVPPSKVKRTLSFMPAVPRNYCEATRSANWPAWRSAM